MHLRYMYLGCRITILIQLAISIGTVHALGYMHLSKLLNMDAPEVHAPEVHKLLYMGAPEVHVPGVHAPEKITIYGRT